MSQLEIVTGLAGGTEMAVVLLVQDRSLLGE